MSMKHAPGTTSQLSPRVASGSPSESPRALDRTSTPGFFLLLNLRLLRQKDPIVRLKSALLVGLSPVRPAGLEFFFSYIILLLSNAPPRAQRGISLYSLFNLSDK